MKNSFRKRISDFVTLHPDELLTIDQFARVIKTWDHEGMSLEAAYDYYKEKFFEVPGTTIHIEEPKLADLFAESKPGFKSINETRLMCIIHRDSYAESVRAK